MIAWAGIEMLEASWESDLGIQALKKWAIDSSAEDDGVLGADGRKRRGQTGAIKRIQWTEKGHNLKQI